MFNSCLTFFSIRSVPRSVAIAFWAENATVDAIIPTSKTNVRGFMFNPSFSKLLKAARNFGLPFGLSIPSFNYIDENTRSPEKLL